jgi:prepilin-type N-terminal cleavage/methylation domain-containing protein
MKREGGFTLIEVLISVAILACGIIAVNRVLLSLVGALNYAEGRMDANRLISNKIWELKDQTRRTRKWVKMQDNGKLYGGVKVYDYEVSSQALDPGNFLYELRVRLGWQSSGRKNVLDRFAYLVLPRRKVGE